METTLRNLPLGASGKITRLTGGGRFQSKLSSLNLRVGKTVTKVTDQPFAGPVVVEVDNTQVTIGRGMAEKILVEVEE